MREDHDSKVAMTKDDRELDARDAYRICRQIAHRHGANFSVGFRFLPRTKRNAVYAAYAFCRRADDIADDPGERISERLDEWQSELDRCYAGKPTDPVTVALADALGHFEIPKTAFIALLDGCRLDMVKRRYATFDELLAYCDLVATSISDISLSIFGYRSNAAPVHGRALATALQLTNVSRDVGDDLQRDRIYLPTEELDRFNVSEGELFEGRRSDRFRELMVFQIDRAESYFRAAEPLLSELSFDARFPTLLMGGVYAEVLRRLRRDPQSVLSGRLSLSRSAKIAVVLTRVMNQRFV
ncbi:MAG TPA: squalene/phytoene synthase family protein [Thermoanaerobaculia bacterium]|nr:squalene/phytoene synthase family protein [Thermoanaerobaculia bacterium]